MRTSFGKVPVPAASSSWTTIVPSCSSVDLEGDPRAEGAAAAGAAGRRREGLFDHLVVLVEDLDAHVRLEDVGAAPEDDAGSRRPG